MDYEKFANTLNKFKIEVSFTKDSSNMIGVADNIRVCFAYKDSIDKDEHLKPSSIAFVTKSLDKNIKINSWLISSNIEVDPVIYKEILNFALIKDSQKVMKLKDCVEHHTAL